MNKLSRHTLIIIIPTAGIALAVGIISAQSSGSSSVPPFSACSQNVNVLSLVSQDPDIAYVNQQRDATESALVQQVSSASSLDQYQQINLLGKLAIYDKTLSPAENISCSSCHVPYAGFTGGVSLLNATVVAQPGSVGVPNAQSPAPTSRFGPRRPQSYAYAAFAPILHYNATQGDFYGGNFWDMRATGIRLGNPAAERAQGPPLNPVEMANPDSACFVWKVSKGQYGSLVETIWGAQSFAINWLADIASACAKPGPPPANDPYPVHLTAQDRGTSNSTFDHITLSIASYEASPEVSAFSSKFDAWLTGNAQFTAEEQAGYDLFNGKGHCNQCHSSGTAVNGGTGQAADLGPLFTSFTSSNIGLPRNLALPYYCETQPDQYGYVANPQGSGFTDLGVGAMLSGPNNPNPMQWGHLAPLFNGKIQTPTLRNVDMRPSADFMKAYMHNGYLKSLKEVVHFYNTSQALPACSQGSSGEKVSCWPAPEVPQNVTAKIGNLGLTSNEEDEIVLFLQTLTDGFVTAPATQAASRPTRPAK